MTRFLPLLFACALVGCGSSGDSTSEQGGDSSTNGDVAGDSSTSDAHADVADARDSSIADSGSSGDDTAIDDTFPALDSLGIDTSSLDGSIDLGVDTGDKCTGVSCGSGLVCCPSTGKCYDPKCLACCSPF